MWIVIKIVTMYAIFPIKVHNSPRKDIKRRKQILSIRNLAIIMDLTEEKKWHKRKSECKEKYFGILGFNATCR